MTFSAGAVDGPPRRQRGGMLEVGQDCEVSAMEGGLAVLLEACERAVEGVGSSVPAAQLRALLVIDGAGSLNLNQLAKGLGASASASSRLCDRMATAGLVNRERAAGSRREVVLVLTEPGRRLAAWVRGQRKVALDDLLGAMGAEGREALIRGLRELAPRPG
jgi:DNA-binding MarR family transcriptional regulator